VTHDVKLGELVQNPDAARDALHFAIVPMTADTRLYPAQHVGIVEGDRVGPVLGNIGIVDPFLVGPVNAGDRVWVMLYQNTITSLRHAWTHPAFEGEGVGGVSPVSPAAAIEGRVKAGAEAWLRDCAEELGLAYKALMTAADEWIESGEYHIFYDRDTPSFDTATFWSSWEHVTGRRAPEDRPHFFSCSC
jgi:hypothetical protein